MNETIWLAEAFEKNRTQLQAIAYRMLGSLSEAEDAVQETWLKLSRTDASSLENLGGWLTTVTARICLDMLRSRKFRAEEPLDVVPQPAPLTSPEQPANAEQEALFADSVGLALLVVLDALDPAERLVFVLHDLFAVPFEEIAPLVGRTEAAARQLASRARRRVQGERSLEAADLGYQRDLVHAFMLASRTGNLDGLLQILAPNVVRRADAAPAIQGVQQVAEKALAKNPLARFARLALIDGVPGIIVAPSGRLRLALRFSFAAQTITEIDVISAPSRLAALQIGVLEMPTP